MTVTIPAWLFWLAFACWPWLLVVVSASLYRPTGGMFDVDIWTPLAFIGAFMWTAAVLLSWGMRWLM